MTHGPTANLELIAPCGMDCSACSFYLAFINGIPKKRGSICHCTGCRPRNKQCAYLKGQCELLAKNSIDFCFECDRYPCERLRKLDQRYRRCYGVSPIENLEVISRQRRQVLPAPTAASGTVVPNAGGMISVHNQKCFACDKVNESEGLALRKQSGKTKSTIANRNSFPRLPHARRVGTARRHVAGLAALSRRLAGKIRADSVGLRRNHSQSGEA